MLAGRNMPSRSKKLFCRAAPDSIAMRAEPMFDEYMKISGTVSQRCWPWKSLMV